MSLPPRHLSVPYGSRQRPGPLGRFYKDPDAALDYGLDWDHWLAGDTIRQSTWRAEDGLSVDSEVFTPTRTTVWVSSGAAGHDYLVTNTVLTAAGRLEECSLLIKVEEL